MTRPDARIDIAFNATYGTAAASRVWTDVTDYVKTAEGIRLGHARGDEFSQAGPNTCALTFDNSDGRFTPGLASSPYYPNVKIGRPLRVVSNLCSFGDWGTFEADATGWTGIDSTVARSTAQAHSGAAGLAVTSTIGGADMSANTPGSTSGIPVVPGATYRASAWYRRPGGDPGRTCDLRVVWSDSGGSTISTDVSASITDTGTWQQIELAATAPVGAAYARVRGRWVSTPIGEVHYIDDVRFDVDRFVGYVDEWPLEWPGVVSTFATSTVTASSRSARLGLSDKQRSVVEEEILLDAPAYYYTFGEPEGSTQANDSSGNGGPALTPEDSPAYFQFPDTISVPANQTAPVFGSATGPETDGLTAVQLSAPAAAAEGSSRILRGHLGSTTIEAVELFFTLTGNVSGTNTVILFGAGPPYAATQQFALYVQSGLLNATTGGLNDGALHHACLRKNGANLELYVDGALEATSAGTMGAFTSFNVGPAESDVDAVTVTLAHLALYSTAPSATRIAAHATAGLTGFLDEAAYLRLGHYADWAGVPAAERSFSTSAITPMAHIDSTGSTPVELMQKVAATDGGVLYDSRGGVLTYISRDARYNATATLTLDVAASEVEVGYSPKLDRSALINKVTATITDGTYSVTAENMTSTAEYGVHSNSDLELATTDTDEAHAAAWWRVNTYGEPTARAPQLGVELAKLSAARQAAILAVKVSDKIAVSNLPAQSDATSKSFFCEGYTETITDSQHRIEFNVSPAAGFDVWEIEHATYGQYDAYPICY